MFKQIARFCLSMAGAWLVGFILILSMHPPTGAASPPPTPQHPPYPPRPPDGVSAPQFAQNAEKVGVAQNLPPLKAVLLVGPIDGDGGSWTTEEKQNMDLAAAELQAHGVTVYKFYTPNNNWEQIKTAANGAHFLFYRGHGVYSGDMPPTWVGGFALKDKFVSSDDIRNDLNLAPNAIVMLYGCFTAGSSSAAGEGQIDITEAKRRVGMYAHPFVDLNISGYYANWFGNAFQMYVRYLFAGQTLGKAYESYFDFNAATVDRSTYPHNAAYVMWLDKDYWSERWQYNNAFVGKPEVDLQEAMGPHLQLTKIVTPAVVESGQMLTYTLSVTNTGFSVAKGFLVKDQLYPFLNFGACSSGCDHNGSATWSNLNIDPGETISFSLMVTATRTYSGMVLWNHGLARYTSVYGTEVDAVGSTATTVINRVLAITHTQLNSSGIWTPTTWLAMTTGILTQTTAFTFSELSGPMVPVDPRFPHPSGYDFRLTATNIPAGTAISQLASPITFTLRIPTLLTPIEKIHLWRWQEDRQQWLDLCQVDQCKYVGQELSVTTMYLGDFTLGLDRADVFLPVVFKQD
ncbi:MAG: DUF11 domain-containing protein [Anaerolineae bacterium]|nr:DUF11 domain-containing protein [Anaerolineae bacterium]